MNLTIKIIMANTKLWIKIIKKFRIKPLIVKAIIIEIMPITKIFFWIVNLHTLKEKAHVNIIILIKQQLDTEIMKIGNK